MSRASSASSEHRRCVYCLEDKSVDDFNEEHVLNQAFGRFNPPVVLDCVCEECNSHFDKTFDRKMARDSPASLARIKEPALRAPSNKSEGKRTKTILQYSAGPWKGAFARHRARLTGEHPLVAEERMVFEPLAQVGFKAEGAVDYRWYLLHDEPTADLVRGALQLPSPDEPVSACVLGVADESTAADALKRIGLTHLRPVPRDAPYAGPVQVDATFELASDEFRCVTKMALSYLAFSQTPAIARMPQFNDVRRFVRDGVEPSQPLVATCVNTWRPPTARGHFLSVKKVGQDVIAQVCLFLELRFVVYLARGGFALPTGFSSAHFLDLASKRSVPIPPPPLPVDSPRTIFGPYANYLTILK